MTWVCTAPPAVCTACCNHSSSVVGSSSTTCDTKEGAGGEADQGDAKGSPRALGPRWAHPLGTCSAAAPWAWLPPLLQSRAAPAGQAPAAAAGRGAGRQALRCCSQGPPPPATRAGGRAPARARRCPFREARRLPCAASGSAAGQGPSAAAGCAAGRPRHTPLVAPAARPPARPYTPTVGLLFCAAWRRWLRPGARGWVGQEQMAAINKPTGPGCGARSALCSRMPG